jgi:O-antigen/teichoic acid export membrane protein
MADLVQTSETKESVLTNQKLEGKFFDTEYLKSDLKGRSVRGGAVTMTAQVIKFVLHTGSTVVLARLLTPQDFGLIAMVTAVTGFVAMFKDMGLSMATVQKAEINHRQISTLFWINVFLSFCVMVVVAALAPAIAWFYSEPRLFWIALALATAFIFGGLTVQHQALLRRQMRFGTLASIQIISLLAGIVAAIVAAWYGLSYWALVIMHLTMAITGTIGVWLASPWRPGLPVRRSGVREMLAFGGNLTGFNIINYFVRNLDNILIGWRWGTESLGLYSKAYGLLMLPLHQINAPLSAVAVPTLSRLQKEPDRFRSYYRKGLTLAAMFGMPIVVFLFVVADKVILIVLGDQWIGAVPIFRVLSLAAFAGTTGAAGSGWVYVALGNVRRRLLSYLAGAILLIIGFFIGLRWGPIGVAAALSICMSAWQIPRTMICFWRTHLKIGDFLSSVWRPTVASTMAGGALFIADRYFAADTNLIIVFLVDCLAYALFYLLFWVSLPGGKCTLTEVLRLVGELRKKRSSEVSYKGAG